MPLPLNSTWVGHSNVHRWSNTCRKGEHFCRRGSTPKMLPLAQSQDPPLSSYSLILRIKTEYSLISCEHLKIWVLN